MIGTKVRDRSPVTVLSSSRIRLRLLRSGRKVAARGRPQVSTPYARTLVIFPQLDFMMPGEIPAELAQQPLVFVGFVAAQAPSAQQLPRPQVEGIAVIPLDRCHRPIFNRVVCAPPAIALHPASGR